MSGGRPTTTRPRRSSPSSPWPKSRGLAGIGLWALGYDAGSIDDWKAIATVYRPAPPKHHKAAHKVVTRPRRSIGSSPARRPPSTSRRPGRQPPVPGAARRLTGRPRRRARQPGSPVRVVPAPGEDGQLVTPGDAGAGGLARTSPSRTPGLGDGQPIEPVVGQDRLHDHRPRRQQARPGRVDRMTLGGLRGRLAAQVGQRRQQPIQVEPRSSIAAGRTLTRFEAVPPTAISSAGCHSGAAPRPAAPRPASR